MEVTRVISPLDTGFESHPPHLIFQGRQSIDKSQFAVVIESGNFQVYGVKSFFKDSALFKSNA